MIDVFFKNIFFFFIVYFFTRPVLQRMLQLAMLNVGQFEHALNELLAWLDKTDQSLDDTSATFGDAKQIEIELAKLKVSLI